MLPRLALLSIVALPLGYLLWPAIGGDATFAYRDAGHYYYPLYQYVAARWGEGGPPLWNPLENGGQPLAADATAAVYYPGKLLFLLPLSYTACWNLYVAGHLVLAAGLVFMAARWRGASPPAATVAALSYALGGSVMAQHANIVYLVGAAWLPLAVAATDALVARPGWSNLALLAFSLAMMVLGGDPQMAYVAVLLGLAYLWVNRRSYEAQSEDAAPAEGATSPNWLVRFSSAPSVWFVGAVLLAAALAAVQVAPGLQWNARTERAYFHSPRSLYEIPEFLAREPTNAAEAPSVAAGLFGRPESDAHHAHAYLFSVGPWRLVEGLWPNCFGREYPENRRWGAVLPNEGPAWSPSLYMGLLPLLLAILSLRWWSGAAYVRWLTWSAAVCIVASFGWFGLGWLWSEVSWLCGGPLDAPVGEPVGGLYWLTTVALPGFVQFRFPAKLCVPAALALSLLAAQGWNRAWGARGSVFVQRGLLVAGGLSLAAIVWALAAGPWWSHWLSNVEPSPLYGPLDATGAWRDLLRDLAHPLVVAVLLLAAWRASMTRAWRPYVPYAALAIIAIELTAAHGWMVQYVPRETIAAPQPMAEVFRGEESSEVPRLYRDEPGQWWPVSWRKATSANRQVEAVAWEQATLRPKYHLSPRVAMLETFGSAQAIDWRQMMHAARVHGPALSDRRRVPDPALLALLGAEGLIGPPGMAGSEAVFQPIDANSAHWPEQTRLWTIRAAERRPRVWICPNVKLAPPPSNHDPHRLAALADEAWYPSGQLCDPRVSAIIESDQTLDDLQTPAARLRDSFNTPVHNEIDLIGETPEKTRHYVVLSQPSLVVFAEAYDPNWTATVHVPDHPERTVQIPVLRAQRALRGIYLPAGAWNVTLEYRPTSHTLGALISLAAMLVLGAIAIRETVFAYGPGDCETTMAPTMQAMPMTSDSAAEPRNA